LPAPRLPYGGQAIIGRRFHRGGCAGGRFPSSQSDRD